MAKVHFTLLDLFVVKVITLVVGASDPFLGAFYEFFYINVRINVPEFPLNKNSNHSNEVQKTYFVELFKTESHSTI